jgi:hypothetical protein
VVPAAANQLGEKLRDIRSVELLVVSAGTRGRFVTEYIIETGDVLSEGVNSFQTYASSILTSLDIANLPQWGEATKGQRISALIEARRDLARLCYRYVFDGTQTIDTSTVLVSDLTVLTPAQWIDLPADFKAALCRAQVIQANHLLGDNDVASKRSDGIISETIGESSTTYERGRQQVRSCCQRSSREVAKYTTPNPRLRRAS